MEKIGPTASSSNRRGRDAGLENEDSETELEKREKGVW